MSESVQINTIQDPTEGTLEFRIKIDVDLSLYEGFDINMQQRLTDAINARDNVAYKNMQQKKNREENDHG